MKHSHLHLLLIKRLQILNLNLDTDFAINLICTILKLFTLYTRDFVQKKLNKAERCNHLCHLQHLHFVKDYYIVCCFRFCKDAFDKNYKATIGVDFEMERFEVLGVPFSLQL